HPRFVARRRAVRREPDLRQLGSLLPAEPAGRDTSGMRGRWRRGRYRRPRREQRRGDRRAFASPPSPPPAPPSPGRPPPSRPRRPLRRSTPPMRPTRRTPTETEVPVSTLLEQAQHALLLSLAVVLPVLAVAAVVGLVVAAFQAASQIQDPTIAHLPRLLAVV